MKMNETEVKRIISDVANKKLSIEEAVRKLKFVPFEDLGFAKIDYHRTLRKGFPEVVFCQNKTIQQVVSILKKLASNSNNVLATRATIGMFNEVKKHIKNARYNEISKTIIIGKDSKYKKGAVLVICAGTSDIGIAEEASVTAEAMGSKVERLYDVGVAGIHRLLSHKERLLKANVIVIVAGMDGVLPSVVSGLIEKPIIAVPTSVGYGASFGGIAPLLTMLNSCSPGVVVVNIDNGFGAGYFASIINK